MRTQINNKQQKLEKISNYLDNLWAKLNDSEIDNILSRIEEVFNSKEKVINWICTKNINIGEDYIIKYIVDKNEKKIEKIKEELIRIEHGVYFRKNIK